VALITSGVELKLNWGGGFISCNPLPFAPYMAVYFTKTNSILHVIRWSVVYPYSLWPG